MVAFDETMNVAEFCPDATCTVGGTLTMRLLLESATLVPPMGASPLRVNVQFADPGPVIVDG